MERDFKGIWIPKKIWLDKNLKIMEKLFLVEISSLDGDKGCYASNAHFSEMFDISKGRCTQIIKSLERKGFIKIRLLKEGKIIKRRTINVMESIDYFKQKQQLSSEMSKKSAKKTKHNFAELKPPYFSQNKWAELLKIKKENGGKISERSIKMMIKELNKSHKAGYSTDKMLDAIETGRGWRTYKHEWAENYYKCPSNGNKIGRCNDCIYRNRCDEQKKESKKQGIDCDSCIIGNPQ